jgi:3-hydroxy-9,10-secoandrosta-1,3,5(10)-triene-9,17-dione monooxygenase reductase component
VADAGDGSFTQNFLGFLLAQAHFQLFEAIRGELRQADIDLNEYFALCALGAGKAATVPQIDQMARFYDCTFSQDTADRLAARGLVEAGAAALKLTDAGFQLTLKLLAIGKNAEAHAQEDFTPEEAQSLRALLKRLTTAAARRNGALA